MSAPAALPEPVQVPSWRLLATLGVAGALAGLLIVVAFQWAQPKVEAHKALVLRQAIEDVLHAPAKADTLFAIGGRLVTDPPASDRKTADRVYRGYDATGRPVGYAITWTEAGFADNIALIFGYAPATKKVLGMRILSSKETPGLGDKIEKDSAFVQQFRGVQGPINGVKGAKPANDPSALVMITGATISSRTVIREINHAIAHWEPLIAAAPAVAQAGGGKR